MISFFSGAEWSSELKKKSIERSGMFWSNFFLSDYFEIFFSFLLVLLKNDQIFNLILAHSFKCAHSDELPLPTPSAWFLVIAPFHPTERIEWIGPMEWNNKILLDRSLRSNTLQYRFIAPQILNLGVDKPQHGIEREDGVTTFHLLNMHHWQSSTLSAAAKFQFLFFLENPILFCFHFRDWQRFSE